MESEIDQFVLWEILCEFYVRLITNPMRKDDNLKNISQENIKNIRKESKVRLINCFQRAIDYFATSKLFIIYSKKNVFFLNKKKKMTKRIIFTFKNFTFFLVMLKLSF